MDHIQEWSIADIEEFKQNFIETNDLSMDDPASLANTIHHSLNAPQNTHIQTTDSQSYFTSILQNILIALSLTDASSKIKYLSFMDSLVAQIALDGRNVIPDFSETYQFTVKNVLEKLEFLENSDATHAELYYWKEKCKAFENQKNNHGLTTVSNDDDYTRVLDAFNSIVHQNLIKFEQSHLFNMMHLEQVELLLNLC